MNTILHSDGCRSLIEYLTLEKTETSRDNLRRLLTKLFEEPDFSKWLEAYASFVPDLRRSMFDLMLNLDEPVHEKGPRGFFERQRLGFLRVREEGRERMLQKLRQVEASDYKSLEETINKYLPPDTPLDIDIYLTIDNFNQGMCRETSVFLSILMIDLETFSIRGLAHEVHHVGVLYWFKKREKWRQWISKDQSPKRLGAELLIYLVGEGLANHLLSPRAISIIERPRSEREKRHNARVQMLEESYPRLVASIEDIVKKALNGEIDSAREEYKGFSMDYSGVGLPSGHFTSAKMIAEILNENDESIVVELIKDPWKLFIMYNNLTRKTHTFSQTVIDFYSGS